MLLALIAARILGQADTCNKIECLPPNLQQLAIKYRNAIAEVLGLPPEAIREDVVVKWVKHWMEAYVKPEYRHRIRALIYTDEVEVVKVPVRKRVGQFEYVVEKPVGFIY